MKKTQKSRINKEIIRFHGINKILLSHEIWVSNVIFIESSIFCFKVPFQQNFVEFCAQILIKH